MDTDFAMVAAAAAENQYSQHRQQWLPHLLPVPRAQSAFNSPVSPGTDYNSPYYPQDHIPTQPQSNSHQNQAIQLTLNTGLAGLSVTSPANQSPINTTPTSALGPGTPLTTASHPAYALQQQHQSQAFTFHSDPSSAPPTRSPPSRRSSQSITADSARPSSSTTDPMTLNKKRSFTNANGGNPNLGLHEVDEGDDGDEFGMSPVYRGCGGASTGGGGNSPIDGSSGEEQHVGSNGLLNTFNGMSGNALGSSTTSTGKPLSSSNNFVSKLYQMINDAKSAHFIAWTELGTSFVVSNVGEFSRSILGSHFKHNNFSSFVRQLNMYGFHKINRTPRAQRTSIDAQTWEFSHRKFLRGRPDLLDEIKRKALEPDLGARQRVELPGEVAAQIGAMREENRRMWEQLNNERFKVDRLNGLVGQLWDVVSKNWPGHLPPFPIDLIEDTPNIYVTHPQQQQVDTHYRYSSGPPPQSHIPQAPHTHLPLPSPLPIPSHAFHAMTPSSSPTGADFPSHHSHPMHPHPGLSRAHSLQQVAFNNNTRNSPTPMDDGDGSGRSKRQRTLDEGPVMGSMQPQQQQQQNANARKRSDSAPMGTYGNFYTNRPRSGSSLGASPEGADEGQDLRNENNQTPMMAMLQMES